MAKRKVIFGMLAMALAMGLFFGGCDNETTPTPTPTVTSVTVTAAGESVAKGGMLQFSADVAGENSPAQTVTWSISTSGIASDTSINHSGLLTVAAGETQTSIEVKATSTVDASKVGTKTVNVTGAATVTSVTVTAAADSVAKGGTLQFSAAVAGENSPAQTVTWNIVTSGIASGTSIRNTGQLIVAADETATSLTVRATSAVDTSKSGTKSVSVTSTGEPSPTVTSVTVTAAADSVAKGGTLQFNASVAGPDSPAQTVSWSIVTSGTASGTSISDSGLLTVATGETQTSIEVKATSTVDASKVGTKTVNVTGTSISIEMVPISGGTFQMGQADISISNAGPVHSVTVSSFNMGKYEVTQAQYRAVMGTNSSYFRGDNLPVERVNWYEAIVFCNKLSMREGLTPAYTISGSTNPDSWGTVPTSSSSTWNAVTVDWSANGYRLPTEAEWEYACRAGTTTAYNTGDEITDNTGWYSGNSGSTTHPVGEKPANDWGLYDMHGNVYEWCWDWYGNYSSASQTDPHGRPAGSDRVWRGGSWSSDGEYLRSANRDTYNPSFRDDNLGFRLVRP